MAHSADRESITVNVFNSFAGRSPAVDGLLRRVWPIFRRRDSDAGPAARDGRLQKRLPFRRTTKKLFERALCVAWPVRLNVQTV